MPVEPASCGLISAFPTLPRLKRSRPGLLPNRYTRMSARQRSMAMPPGIMILTALMMGRRGSRRQPHRSIRQLRNSPMPRPMIVFVNALAQTDYDAQACTDAVRQDVFEKRGDGILTLQIRYEPELATEFDMPADAVAYTLVSMQATAFPDPGSAFPWPLNHLSLLVPPPAEYSPKRSGVRPAIRVPGEMSMRRANGPRQVAAGTGWDPGSDPFIRLIHAGVTPTTPCASLP